jgi:hypothetical protein
MSENSLITSVGPAAKSVWSGIQEYAGKNEGIYKGIQLGAIILGSMPAAECGANLNRTFSSFMDVSDAAGIVPDTMGALGDLKNNLIENCSEYGKHDKLSDRIKNIKIDVLSFAQNVSVIALDSLAVVALCGGAGLLDLGKMAASIGGAEIFGATPLAFVAKVALCPTMRVVYIVVLATSTLSEIRSYRSAADSKDDSRQVKREALWKIASNTTGIALQSLLLVVSANPVVSVGLGLVNVSTAIAAGVVKTEAMRKYFNAVENAA